MAEPWSVQLWLAAQAGRDDDVRRLLGCPACTIDYERAIWLEIDDSDYKDRVDAIWRALDVTVCNDHVASTAAMLTAARALDERSVELLHAAARNCSSSTLQLLLAYGVQVDEHFEGRSCVRVAAEHGHVNIAKVLVAHGADVNSNISPLLDAAQAGDLDMAHFLLESKAVVDTGDDDFSALLCAAQHKHWDVVELFLQRGAVVDAVDSCAGWTSLALAAMYGHCETAELLLCCKAAVDGADSRSVPLAAAVERGHVAMASLLLQHKAAVDKETGKFRQTPLMIAAGGGHVESARLLLEHKASVVHFGTHGMAPLACACDKGHVELAKVLLAHDAPVNLDVPLVHACDRGHLEVAKVLLDHKAAIDQTDRLQRTPLICAIRANREPVVRLLVERGADIEWHLGPEGPPLAQAVEYGHADLAEFLVSSKASVECRGRNGATLLDMAMERETQQWVRGNGTSESRADTF
jgi:ankyrin repeat protein